MVGFAGWSLPVQYEGALAEHRAARTQAALFDVSHMGQVTLRVTAGEIETLVPGDIAGLAPGRQRYTLLLNEAGGILDDVMVAHWPDGFVMIVNAARAAADLAHLRQAFGDAAVEHGEGRALLALQGPEAAAVMARHAPAAVALPFLGLAEVAIAGVACRVSRSGYTGEDGFEIACAGEGAVAVAEALLAEPEVLPAGLAARDTLRLEAGLCLYGNDIDEVTTPVEAGLAWTIGKRRRAARDFPGAEPIADQLAQGAPRCRVGLRPEGRAIARGGAAIAAPDGSEAGIVTSGGFAPSLGGPIAMGYVRRDLAVPGTALGIEVRGQRLPAQVVALPFVPHRFAR